MPVIDLKKDAEEINNILKDKSPENLVYQQRVVDYRKKFREIMNDIERGGGDIESCIQFQDKSMRDLVGGPRMGEDPKERKEQLATVLADMAARYPTLPEGERGIFTAYIPANGKIREQNMMNARELNADPYPVPKLNWWDKFCRALHIKTERVLLTEQIEARRQADLAKKEKIREGMGMEKQRKEFLAKNEKTCSDNFKLVMDSRAEEEKWEKLFFEDEKPKQYEMYDGTTISPYSACLGRLAHKGYLNRMDPKKPWTPDEIKKNCGENAIREVKEWYKEKLRENEQLRYREKHENLSMAARDVSMLRCQWDQSVKDGLTPHPGLRGITPVALNAKQSIPLTREQALEAWPLAKFKSEMSEIELSKGTCYRDNMAGEKETMGCICRAVREYKIYEAVFYRQYEDVRKLSESAFRYAVKTNARVDAERKVFSSGNQITEKGMQVLDNSVEKYCRERNQTPVEKRSYKEVFKLADMVVNHKEREELEIIPSEKLDKLEVKGMASDEHEIFNSDNPDMESRAKAYVEDEAPEMG